MPQRKRPQFAKASGPCRFLAICGGSASGGLPQFDEQEQGGDGGGKDEGEEEEVDDEEALAPKATPPATQEDEDEDEEAPIPVPAKAKTMSVKKIKTVPAKK